MNQFVLDVLDKKELIADSKDLQYENQPVDQLQLLGVLNALQSREVSYSMNDELHE